MGSLVIFWNSSRLRAPLPSLSACAKSPRIFLEWMAMSRVLHEHDAVVVCGHLESLLYEDSVDHGKHREANEQLVHHEEDEPPLAEVLRKRPAGRHPIAQGNLEHGEQRPPEAAIVLVSLE